MPTSVLLVAERAVTYAGTIVPTPQRVLDVGPGYGKYGVLLREYLDPTPVIDAVEAWLPYIHDHGLEGIYREVMWCRAEDIHDDDLATYDLVMMGDVIEHMEKDGRKFDAIILDPPPTEAHVSHWTLDDFQSTGRLQRHEVSYGAHIVRLAPLGSAP